MTRMKRTALVLGLVLLVIVISCISGVVGAHLSSPLILESWDGLVEVRSAKTLTRSGSEIGRGALRLTDTIDRRIFELGWYEYGAGLFVNDLFEAWTDGFSIRSFTGETEPFLAVRDQGDFNDIRLRHDGRDGHIETEGWHIGLVDVWTVPFASPNDRRGLMMRDDGNLYFRHPQTGHMTQLSFSAPLTDN